MSTHFFSLVFTCTFLLSANLFGQRVGTENLKIQVNQLPSNLLPEEYTTYSCSVNSKGSELDLAGYTASGLMESHFTLRSFNRLDKGGHFHINVEIGRLIVEKTEDFTDESSRKNDDGETITTKSYYKKVSYRMPIRLTVEDVNGKVWLERLEGSPRRGLYYDFKNESGRTKINFETLKDLNEAWVDGTATKNVLRRQTVNAAFMAFSAEIKEQFDIRVGDEDVTLLVPKGKRINNEAAFERQALLAKEILATLTIENGLVERREELQTTLTFWENEMGNYDADDRREAKVFVACAQNLAVVNFYLEDFEKARGFLAQTAEINFRDKERDALESSITETINALTLNNRASRYFKVEPGEAIGPANADYSKYTTGPAAFVAAGSNRIEVIDGYVITQNGDSLSGQFVFTNSLASSKPIFSVGGNVKFEYEFNGRQANRVLDPDWFSTAVFNGRIFQSIAYKKPNGLRKKAAILEAIMENKGVNLYWDYSFEKYDDTPRFATDLVIQKAGEDYHNLGIDNLRFANWRKSFEAFFAGCETLCEEIRLGEYKRNDADIIRAVRTYNQSDCD